MMQASSRREWLNRGWKFLYGLLGTRAFGAKPAERPLAPAAVHKELVAGNLRFASGHARHPHASPKRLRDAARQGQHPHAIILCCSDSRVSPEILFDQGIGDLFVVRVAGNVLREDEIASIEYAVEHLHVPLCVVLGHTSCGAVSSVVDEEELPLEVEHLVAPIREARAALRQERLLTSSREAWIDLIAREHARRTRDAVGSASSLLRESLRRQHFQVEAALYRLDDGRVEWL